MQQFKVGIVGCGGISSVHIPALMETEGVTIAAVCDTDPARARAAAEATGAVVERDFDAMIARADIDAVHLLTPHHLHAPMAIAALAAGKHVLTEKPMATTLSDARAMIAAARTSAGRLGVIFQNRYNPATIELKRLILSGAGGAFLGARVIVNWRRDAAYYTQSGWRGFYATEGGGVLINQAIHTLDLAGYIPGRAVARVRGHISTDILSDVIEVESACHAVAEYEGGGRLIIHATNDYAFDAPVILEMACENRRWQIIGDELYDATDGMRLLLGGEEPSVSGKAYWGANHAIQIRDFYDCIVTGRAFLLDGAAGYPALNLVKAIHLSAQTGDWVALDDPKEL
ncbi:MAG: Gfo/Idh/MocA family protein [Christensenellales bacterium]|jgi:UDP-N-acetyl-2-amino-2-deoxyglucuronate dehydrogenase